MYAVFVLWQALGICHQLRARDGPGDAKGEEWQMLTPDFPTQPSSHSPVKL